jgi:hypothetical protein
MNTRPPATDPPDPHELEFARVLRALPGGEPSPALDARILGAARDALAEPKPRRRYGLWTATSGGAAWGIGSAAAAILAVGLAWKINAPPLDTTPPPEPRVMRTNAELHDQQTTTVDFVEAEKAVVAPGPPPPPPSEPITERRRQVAAKPQAQPSPVLIAPEPSPEPFVDEHVELAEAARERAVGNELGAAAGSGLIAAAPAPAAPPAPTTGSRTDGYLARQEVAKVAADASAAAAVAQSSAEADAAAVPALRDNDEPATQARARVLVDARRAPDSWLLKIRARLREGDVTGARASLRLYTERYPQRVVPEDLRPLLRQ